MLWHHFGHIRSEHHLDPDNFFLKIFVSLLMVPTRYIWGQKCRKSVVLCFNFYTTSCSWIWTRRFQIDKCPLIQTSKFTDWNKCWRIHCLIGTDRTAAAWPEHCIDMLKHVHRGSMLRPSDQLSDMQESVGIQMWAGIFLHLMLRKWHWWYTCYGLTYTEAQHWVRPQECRDGSGLLPQQQCNRWKKVWGKSLGLRVRWWCREWGKSLGGGGLGARRITEAAGDPQERTRAPAED